MEILLDVLLVLFAYLLGAVPFGLLITRLLTGEDVRSVGSGNIGATNVLRAAGKKAAALTLIADCLKGAVPVLLAPLLREGTVLPVMTGMAAVLGHNFPVYLRFRGGKGVATGYGAMLALTPWPGAACLFIWIATALLWRYSSLSALISFGAYPFLVFTFYPESRPLGFFAMFLAGMIYIRHRENIRRLLEGSETKIGGKRTGQPKQS